MPLPTVLLESILIAGIIYKCIISGLKAMPAKCKFEEFMTHELKELVCVVIQWR